MKNIIVTGALLSLGLISFGQSSLSANASATSVPTNMLFSKSPDAVKPTDCVGEWIADGNHLTLYSNNKAVWKDEGHIYYMSWHSDNVSLDGNIKISLSGNDYCKHKSFNLSETDNGMDLVEDQTNFHMHSSRQLTATIQ